MELEPAVLDPETGALEVDALRLGLRLAPRAADPMAGLDASLLSRG